MFVSRVFLILAFACPSGAARTRPSIASTASTGKVCSISENAEDGGGIYNIRFALNMEEAGGCSKVKTCNFFKMDHLAKLFLDKPTQTPREGSVGRCRCNLKKMQAGDSAVLPGAKDDTLLLDFMWGPDEPCEEAQCWVKYNQFVNIASRKEGSKNHDNESSNGNHWKIGCEDGDASLTGLKTFQQLFDETSVEDRKKFSEASNSIRMLPQPEQVFAPDEDFEMAPMVLKRPAVEYGFGTSEDESVDGSGTLDDDEAEYGFGTLDDEAQYGFGDLIDNADEDFNGGETAQTASKTSHKAVRLLEKVEEELGKMVTVANVFTVVTKMMKDGKVNDAVLGDWEVVEALYNNMLTLARFLKPNQDVSFAFASACELYDEKPYFKPFAVVDFFRASEKALQVQNQVVDNLSDLFHTTITAFQEFSKRDGENSDFKAQYIAKQLVLLRKTVRGARVELKQAVVKLSA